MLRAGVSAADIAALLARIWTRFAVLEVGHPPAWRPVSQAPDLWQELGETGPFTNILLVR
jgi:hypothetical protein